MLTTAIAARDGSRDPDTMFGYLVFLEAGGSINSLGKLAKGMEGLVDRAREGRIGRVEAFRGDERRKEVLDFPDGLFAIRWQRDLIPLLLRPDGVTTEEVETALSTAGEWNASSAMTRLRSTLKDFSIRIESHRFEGRNDFSYRITGTSAWRMQKIISNGWAL